MASFVPVLPLPLFLSLSSSDVLWFVAAVPNVTSILYTYHAQVGILMVLVCKLYSHLFCSLCFSLSFPVGVGWYFLACSFKLPIGIWVYLYCTFCTVTELPLSVQFVQFYLLIISLLVLWFVVISLLVVWFAVVISLLVVWFVVVISLLVVWFAVVISFLVVWFAVVISLLVVWFAVVTSLLVMWFAVVISLLVVWFAHCKL